MSLARTAALALAGAAALAAGPGATSASAQVSLPPMTWNPAEAPLIQVVKGMVGQPPCTPGAPVNEAVNCTFDTTVWGLEKAQWAVVVAQAAVNQVYGQVEATTKEALVRLDEAEKTAVGAACFALGIPAEDCPDI